jgi:hypothetical protein
VRYVCVCVLTAPRCVSHAVVVCVCVCLRGWFVCCAVLWLSLCSACRAQCVASAPIQRSPATHTLAAIQAEPANTSGGNRCLRMCLISHSKVARWAYLLLSPTKRNGLLLLVCAGAACSSAPSDLEQSTVPSGTIQRSKQALCAVVPYAYPLRPPARFPLLPAAFPVVQCPAL